MLLVSTALWATDPFVGKWTLNVQKSKYPPGTCPKHMVIEIEPAGHGIRYHSETTSANGSFTSSDYTADYSGKQAIVLGSVSMFFMIRISYARLENAGGVSYRYFSCRRNLLISPFLKPSEFEL